MGKYTTIQVKRELYKELHNYCCENGYSKSGLVEMVEIPSHPFFIGVQYHPELKSTVEKPAHLFVHFIAAAKAYAKK